MKEYLRAPWVLGRDIGVRPLYETCIHYKEGDSYSVLAEAYPCGEDAERSEHDGDSLESCNYESEWEVARLISKAPELRDLVLAAIATDNDGVLSAEWHGKAKAVIDAIAGYE